MVKQETMVYQPNIMPVVGIQQQVAMTQPQSYMITTQAPIGQNLGMQDILSHHQTQNQIPQAIQTHSQTAFPTQMGFQGDIETQQAVTLQNQQYQAALQQQYQNLGNMYQQPQTNIQVGIPGVQTNIAGMNINGMEGTY